MMRLRTSCTLVVNPDADTPFIFMLRPRSGWQQWIIREQYLMTPSLPVFEFADTFGNLCQRVIVPPGRLLIQTTAEADVADKSDSVPGAPFVEVPQLPEATLPFLMPSRYCESDCFAEMATAITNCHQPGYDQCAAIVEHIRATIRYVPGSSRQALSACQVNQLSEAVCRDMAHLGIALCRALAIPARMVVGYLQSLQPMDMHAWFEAYVGGRWYTFDPTQGDLDGGRLAVAYGRDAADVAIYTQFGDPVDLLRMEVTAAQTTQ